MGSACRIMGRSTERRPRSDTATTWPSALVDAELRTSALVDNPESRAACGQLGDHPAPLRGRPRTDPPGATPTSRPVRSGPAEGSPGRIPRGPPSGTSHRSRRKRRPRYRDPGLGHWARRRGPPALLALLRRRALSTTCMGYQHRRALYPPRDDNNPLTMSTTPSRCRQRAPVRSALEHPVLETRPPLTTRARAGRATALRAHWANPSVWCHSPGYAHKDPDLRNIRCTQRLDSALVCDPVFPNSLPCVRSRGTGGQRTRAPAGESASTSVSTAPACLAAARPTPRPGHY